MKTWILLCLLLFTSPAFAQDYERAIQSGNTAYNAGDYKAAQTQYVLAVQADPTRAVAYRNLARAFFWQDQYSAASHFYEHYLKLAPPEAVDLEQVRGERKLAATRAGDAIYRIPENALLARQALETELQSGRAYTEGGGGAWGLYETLLRTSYADPDLIQLRTTLGRRLLDEFDALLLPTANDLLPVASFEAWQVQAQRLVALRRIQQSPTMLEMINRRSTVVEAALALLGGQIDGAVDLARLARGNNPDLKFLPWYEIIALTRANRHEEALTALETFSRQLRSDNPSQLPYAMVVRAVILKRHDRPQDAAEVLRAMLSSTAK